MLRSEKRYHAKNWLDAIDNDPVKFGIDEKHLRNVSRLIKGKVKQDGEKGSK